LCAPSYVTVETPGRALTLYGSDTVAGVANFITRNKFQGVEIRVESRKIQDTPANKPNLNLGIIVGVGDDRTHVVTSLDYATTKVLLVEDRYEDSRLRPGLTVS